jgi:hypothetical protein
MADKPHGLRELSAEQRQRIAGWRGRISTTWQRHVEAVIETGKLLIEAHDDLIGIHGAWLSMVRNDLPFKYATAKKLIAIAHHPVLASGSHENHLPASWTTLYELSQIDEATLGNLLETGQVTPHTERKDVERLRRTTAAGQSIATMTHDDKVAYAMSQWQAATTRAFNFVWDRLTHGPMTDAELTAVVETCATIAGQIDGFIDAVGKFRIEPMRTVYEPMWDDNDQSNRTLDATARRGKNEDDTGA